MNSLLLTALLATAVVAVLSNDVGEAKATVTEVEKYEYDEYGVPLRTVPDERQSLTVGVVGPDDRLMARVNHGVAAAQFLVHDNDITIRGAEFTNITAVQVTRTGTTQHAIPSIKAGGLGYNYVTVRILGVRGRGYDYTINVYSSIGCDDSKDYEPPYSTTVS